MLIHPAVLNMAHATVSRKSRRCWCWTITAILCGVVAYLLLTGILAFNAT
jgi:hypothetical protein